MRTTLTLDDDLIVELKERAHRDNLTFKQVVNQVIRRGLDAQAPRTPRKRYRATTYAMGRPQVPNLDTALAIAAALANDETARKLALRK